MDQNHDVSIAAKAVTQQPSVPKRWWTLKTDFALSVEEKDTKLINAKLEKAKEKARALSRPWRRVWSRTPLGIT